MTDGNLKLPLDLEPVSMHRVHIFVRALISINT
jgi:hypothetical protein